MKSFKLQDSQMRPADANALNIAGLVPFSTVDWPGKLVAVVFCQGCPWRCPYCHNAQILDPRAVGDVTWKQVTDLLETRRGLLDGVVFSGGEALMQASSGVLPTAMREVRARGFQVGLHAGGAFPDQMGALLDEGVVDWVGLDIKALPDDYDRVTGRPGGARRAEQSLAVLANHPNVDHEVRLTLWPGVLGEGLWSERRSEIESGSEPDVAGLADAVVAYAVEVARWARERGARKFALQRYRPVEAQPPVSVQEQKGQKHSENGSAALPPHLQEGRSTDPRHGQTVQAPSWSAEERVWEAFLLTDGGWDDRIARGELEKLGFDEVTVR